MSCSQDAREARRLRRNERDRERRSETEEEKETRQMLEIGLVTPADNKWSPLTEKVTCLKKELGCGR